VGARDAGDEAPSAEPPQVVGHLVGSVGLSEQRLDEAAQIAMAKAMDLEAIVAQSGEQGHGAGIAETQSGDALALRGP